MFASTEKGQPLPLGNKSTLLGEEWQFVNDIPGKSIGAGRNLTGPNQNPPER